MKHSTIPVVHSMERQMRQKSVYFVNWIVSRSPGSRRDLWDRSTAIFEFGRTFYGHGRKPVFFRITNPNLTPNVCERAHVATALNPRVTNACIAPRWNGCHCRRNDLHAQPIGTASNDRRPVEVLQIMTAFLILLGSPTEQTTATAVLSYIAISFWPLGRNSNTLMHISYF